MCNIDEFPTTIQMLNNELASFTWARLTWEQRFKQSSLFAYANNPSLTDGIEYYANLQSYLAYEPVVCETLSQMQF